MKRASVIGGGAWGTALAVAASRAGLKVVLWAREEAVVADINARHENPSFLPDVTMPPDIHATTDITATLDADFILLVCPAQHLRDITSRLKPRIGKTPVVICAKGLEQPRGALMSEVAAATLGQTPLAVLSGPTFAIEVAHGLPTAVTLACADAEIGAALVAALGSAAFRPYYTDDVAGAEIGGAVKNVLAIAAGIAIGRGLGENARAAITTRGFAEMARLAIAKGGRLDTLAGLSGLGDLMLTCTSQKSRNFSLGRALGAGKALSEIMGARSSVAEGVSSAPAVAALGESVGVDMPIARAVDHVLHRNGDIDDVITALLARPFKTEGGIDLDAIARLA
jgi:glycerol-3-phosphate dehydrogenase (NAD(P)+)